MFKKIILIIIALSIVLLISIKVYQNLSQSVIDTKEIECNLIEDQFGIELNSSYSCHYIRNGLGRIEGINASLNETDSISLLYDSDTDLDHYIKDSRTKVEEWEDEYLDDPLDIAVYTYFISSLNDHSDNYNVLFYWYADDFMIYGSLNMTNLNFNQNDFKEKVTQHIKEFLDDAIYVKGI